MIQTPTQLEGVRRKVFLDRYALRDDKGNNVEQAPEEMWRRVALAIAETEYDNNPHADSDVVDATEERFYGILRDFKFVPGGRILSGAGTGNEVTFYNCFVIPQPEDSRGGILETLRVMTEIMARGGGVGINGSSIRPRGAYVASVNGTASGPVNWMEIFSVMTGKIIQQGGSRRGALMLMLDDDHPDILEFVEAKKIDPRTNQPVALEYANVSVAVSDAFMAAVKADGEWRTQFPTKANARPGDTIVAGPTYRARALWEKICERAWATAEPGLVFMERGQREANTWYYENIRCVNPCGEQLLPEWGVCNLGSMNLAAYVDDDRLFGPSFDFQTFERDVKTAVRFLDNVIDRTPYFLPENEAQQKGTRRIGLGTMGLADALIKLGIRYGSPHSLELVGHIYRTLRDAAYDASIDLAAEKGPFPRFDREKYLQGQFIQRLPEHLRVGIASNGIRNAVLLTQAPTGSTSLLSGVSSGIEPVFAFKLQRQDRTGTHVIDHPLLAAWKADHPGEAVPGHFVTTMELTKEEHVAVQAAAQLYIDSSISKTVNGPSTDTVADVMDLYMAAYDRGLKGVTYYRDGSRDAVLTAIADQAEADGEMTEEQVSQIVQEVVSAAFATEIAPRPPLLSGYTREVATPVGDAHVTVNCDDHGPFEVFVNIGRAGSDLTADSEAIGRLISLMLRMPSALSRGERLAEIASQLRGIGGSGSVGFGPNQTRSLADGLAKVFDAHWEWELKQPDPGASGRVDPNILIFEDEIVDLDSRTIYPLPQARTGSFCPECSNASLVYEEGCKHCLVCGYSAC